MAIGQAYNMATIIAAARAAGFPTKDLPTAVAIALAESGGKSVKGGPNGDGTYDYGVWQINTVHSSLLASGDWSDINVNARMAYTLYHARGDNFTDWATYNGRIPKYLTFLPGAEAVVKTANPATGAVDLSPPFTLPTVPTPTSIASSIPGVAQLGKAASYLTDGGIWRRIGIGYLGYMLIIVGIVFLLAQSKTVQGVVSTVVTKGAVKGAATAGAVKP